MAKRRTRTKPLLLAAADASEGQSMAAIAEARFLAAGGKVANDAFSNPAARIGYGTPSLQESAGYQINRLSWDFMLLTSLFRDNWIARKVVECVPEDAHKNGFRLTCQVSPQEIDEFQRVWEETASAERMLQADTWAQLYGGAIGVILIKDQASMLSSPLDLEDITPGSYRGLLVLDRWSGVMPSTASLVSDLDDPQEFGLPEFYDCSTVGVGSGARTFRVHHSRVIRFIGPDVPNWEKQAESYWGISKIETMFAELKKRDNSSWSIANLMFRAQIMAIQSPDLSQKLTAVQLDVQQGAYRALEGLNHLMSNQGLTVLPKDAQLQSHQYSFGGIGEMYVNFMLDICGATGIPMSRLFGRSATGLGQTGEGDENIYFASVTARQHRTLRPQLMKLCRVVAMSAWGELPADFNFKFNPIKEPNGKELAELAKTKSEAILAAYNAGAITQQCTMMELRNLADETGLFSSITDDDINAASTELQSPGELALGQEGELDGGPDGTSKEV